MLGVTAARGRLLGPGDDRSYAPPVAVLSHSFWTRRFGASSDAIVRTIAVNDATFTVVGVVSADFTVLMSPLRGDFWLPLSADALLRPALEPAARMDSLTMHLVGRLKPRFRSRARADRVDSISRHAATPRRAADALVRELVERLEAAPGVVSANVLDIVPLTLSNRAGHRLRTATPNPSRAGATSMPIVYMNTVGPAHFRRSRLHSSPRWISPITTTVPRRLSPSSTKRSHAASRQRVMPSASTCICVPCARVLNATISCRSRRSLQQLRERQRGAETVHVPAVRAGLHAARARCWCERRACRPATLPTISERSERA